MWTAWQPLRLRPACRDKPAPHRQARSSCRLAPQHAYALPPCAQVAAQRADRTLDVGAVLQECVALLVAALQPGAQLVSQLLVAQRGAGVADDGHVFWQKAAGGAGAGGKADRCRQRCLGGQQWGREGVARRLQRMRRPLTRCGRGTAALGRSSCWPGRPRRLPGVRGSRRVMLVSHRRHEWRRDGGSGRVRWAVGRGGRIVRRKA